MLIRIGFIPLADCAPLVIAFEKGFFHDEGIEIELAKAQSWEQLRQKLARGDFQAAQIPATLPLLAALGIDGSRELLCTAWTLAQSGNAITLSNRLWRAGVTDAASLRDFLDSPDAPEVLHFGIVHPRSTHELMILEWLSMAGLEVGDRIRLVVSPPQEMVRHLRDGEIDGFCAGEPWNQRATTSKLGGIVALGEDVTSPGAEKVLAVTPAWHRANAPTHAAILRALDKASRWLALEENLDEAATLVAGKRYVNTQESLLRDALHHKVQAGWGRELRGKRFLRFSGPGCNAPNVADFRWYLERMVLRGIATPKDLDLDLDKICLTEFHREVFPAGDGTDRVFGFESEFARELRCIPMVVRRKLDAVGIKLSLAQWSAFPVEARTRLVETLSDTPLLESAWRSLLLETVRSHTADEARELPLDSAPAWLHLDAIPPELAAQATTSGIALGIAQWRALDALQRFALIKLSRPGHENRNFLPAAQEFGLG